MAVCPESPLLRGGDHMTLGTVTAGVDCRLTLTAGAWMEPRGGVRRPQDVDGPLPRSAKRRGWRHGVAGPGFQPSGDSRLGSTASGQRGAHDAVALLGDEAARDVVAQQPCELGQSRVQELRVWLRSRLAVLAQRQQQRVHPGGSGRVQDRKMLLLVEVLMVDPHGTVIHCEQALARQGPVCRVARQAPPSPVRRHQRRLADGQPPLHGVGQSVRRQDQRC
mmetsp:Transcript_114365/g.364570  ORF Transcript_114365/g.364570 Transcript_114365/m.364570 type:complete len:221 (+) Transcript_114365:739-1401(+)